MRAVVQRVKHSSVTVGGELISEISKGLNVLIGAQKSDTQQDVKYMANKIAALRVFEDNEGKLNLSVKDRGGEVLLVSQFTLLGDARKGNRPSFINAAGYEEGKKLCEMLLEELCLMGIKTGYGVYGADMNVLIENDGPVTILIDSRKIF